MSFIISNTEQQIKESTSNFNFSHLQQQSRNLSFGSTTASTGIVLGTTTITTAPSGFSFCCTTPAQANGPNTGYLYGVLPSTKSFGTTDTSIPLSNLFGATVTTASTGFSIPSLTTSAFDFGTRTATEQKYGNGMIPTTAVGFGTAAATTKNSGFSFRNDTYTKTSVGFGMDPLLFSQTAANTSSSLGTTRITASTLQSNLNSAASASTGFFFSDALKANNFGGTLTTAKGSFTPTDDVTASLDFAGSASINAASGFNFRTQQPSKLRFETPYTRSVVISTASPGLTFDPPQTFVNTPGPSQLSCLAQSGTGDNFVTPNRTVLKKIEVTRNQCFYCMSEHENKSLEEIRLEDYDSKRKASSVDSGLGYNNDAFQPMKGLLSQTQDKEISTGFGTPSTSMTVSFGLSRIFNTSLFDQNKQNKDLALAPSNVDNTMDHSEKSQNIPEPNSEDPKCKSIVNEGSNVSGSYYSILSQHLGVSAANCVKKLALDALISLMIVTKTKSIPEVLNMVPGNAGLDDFRAHLICAAEELLLKNVTEPVTQPAKTSSKIIHIKLPTGEILIHSFMADTPLSLLLTYIASQGYPDIEYKVLTTWPCQDLTALNKSQTLEDLKLLSKDYLTVEKK